MADPPTPLTPGGASTSFVAGTSPLTPMAQDSQDSAPFAPSPTAAMTATPPAAATAAASEPADPTVVPFVVASGGKGKKRASESVQQADVDEGGPRKKRAAVTKAKRIVLSEDEDEDEGGNGDHSGQTQRTAAVTGEDSYTGPGEEGDADGKGKKVGKVKLRLTAGGARGSTKPGRGRGRGAKTKTTGAGTRASPAAPTRSKVASGSEEPALSTAPEQSAEAGNTRASASLAVENLFDDEPAPTEALQGNVTPSFADSTSADTLSANTQILGRTAQGSNTPSEQHRSATARDTALGPLRKSATAPDMAASASASSDAGTQPSVKQKTVASAKVSGSGTPSGMAKPSISASASGGQSSVNVKKLKRPGPGASTPRPAPPPPPKPETSFLDSLFTDIVPQTEHERQLAKEREAKAAKAAKDREAAEKREQAKEAAREKALPPRIQVRSAINGNTASPAGLSAKKSGSGSALPKPIVLQSSRSTMGMSRESNLQARLAGQKEARKEEVQKQRMEAKRHREEVAAAGGFDLLAQGLEMGAFEGPLLRDWNAHQQIAYQSHRYDNDRKKTFPYYNGKPAKPSNPSGHSAGETGGSTEEEEEEEGEERELSVGIDEPVQPLPHPWTFGAAFVYAGARKKQTA